MWVEKSRDFIYEHVSCRGRETAHYTVYWGLILGRNTEKSLKSFPVCYSQSPLQLCLEISSSSNSHNLLQFLHFSYCTLKRRKEQNLIENHTPFPMFKKSIQKPQVWKLSRLCLETPSKLHSYIHEFGFCKEEDESSCDCWSSQNITKIKTMLQWILSWETL
jgi:hypothetical protein